MNRLVTSGAAARLAANRKPTPVEHAAERILGGPLKLDVEMRYPEEGRAYPVLRGVERPRGITAQQIGDLRAMLDAQMRPAPSETIAKLIAELATITVARPEASGDLKVRTAALTVRMEGYPADAVRAVLKEPFKWFPSWGELEPKLEAMTRLRRGLRDAVAGWKPWSTEDEIAWLDAAEREARFNARYYANSDPKAAKAWAERAAQAAAKLAKAKEVVEHV